MSRIGKEPVKVPAGATVSVKDGVVAVKGPKGELKYALPPGIECKVEDGVARFTRHLVDYNCRNAARRAHGTVELVLAKSYFPAGTSVLAVRPRGFNGQLGQPIRKEITV